MRIALVSLVCAVALTAGSAWATTEPVYQFASIGNPYKIPGTANVSILPLSQEGDAISISLWLTPDALGEWSMTGLFARVPDDSSYNWSPTVYLYTNDGSHNGIAFKYGWHNGKNGGVIDGGGNILAGAKTHVAAVMQCVGGRYAVDFYINGAYLAGGVDSTAGYDTYYQDNPIRLGQYFTDSNHWYNKFPGLMEDYRIYNRVLSSQEITALATPAGAPVPEPLTMAAVGMGIAGLGGYIRRRTKA